MTLAELLQGLPDAALVPVGWLREQLAGAMPRGEPQACSDLGVEQLAQALGRRPSTVRGWLEAGRFPGAYQLPTSGKVSAKTGRPKRGAWRVPAGALAAFRAGHGNGKRRRGSAGLGDWQAFVPGANVPPGPSGRRS